MSIQKIQINNFRNIENQFLEPKKGINYFVGNNAQGKTSFIEAIYYLGHNKSFKTTSIKNIIQNGKNEIFIQAIFKNTKIKLKKNNKNTFVELDGKKILNSSFLSKLIPIQLITPDRGFLVNGDNKNKRYYLDWGVFHVEHKFFELSKKYKKIQKNINTLINTKQFKLEDKIQLSLWFKEFAKITTSINNIRINYLIDLQKINTSDFFKNIIVNLSSFKYVFNNGLPLGIKNNEEDIYDFLIKNTDKIIKNKYLKYGPHLATIDFYFNNNKEHQLSRGEQKTLSIVFWLTQVLHLTKQGIEPLILIDDLPSELDKDKIKIIINFLEKIKTQVFITSIKPINDCSFWNIENGEIVYNK